MRNLKIFPKMFLYTFSTLCILAILIHALIYFIFPKVYLETRKQEIAQKADQITKNIQGKNIESIKQILELYSKSSKVKAFVKDNDHLNEIKIDNQIEADLTSNNNSLVIEDREVQTDSNKKILVKFISTTDMNKDAKELTFQFLPISILFSFFFSIIVSLIYAKIITKNINEIKTTTAQMMKLNRNAKLKVNSTNEVGALKSQINDLYSTLLESIDGLEIKNQEITKLEKLKSEFFRGTSHELKTPLASLKIILENMKYGIGKYKNKEKSIEDCLNIVDQLTQNIAQILSTSSFESLKNDEKLININKVLQKVLDSYKLLAEQRNISINNQLRQEEIYIGETALEIILSNLVSNAVKHSDQNGQINIGVKNNWFYIENSNQKIKDSRNTKIFETNFDLNKEKGSGFGLYIVKNILTNYKIKYKIENSKIGIKFLIDLSKK